MAIKLRKKIILSVVLIGMASMLALAGKLIVDKKMKSPVVAAPAQPEAREEYTKLMRKFLERDAVIRMEGTISLYDGEHEGILKEKSRFVFLRSGSSFYSGMSYQQSFSNGKLLVQLDSLHKILFVAAPDEGAKGPAANADPVGMLDKLFSDTASFKVRGTVTGDDRERSILMRSDFNPEIQFFSIRYSPADYSLKSAEVRFWKNSQYSGDSTINQDKVWISKIEYRQSPMKEGSIDSMINKVLVIRGKTIEPTPAYKDYRVIIK